MARSSSIPGLGWSPCGRGTSSWRSAGLEPAPRAALFQLRELVAGHIRWRVAAGGCDELVEAAHHRADPHFVPGPTDERETTGGRREFDLGDLGPREAHRLAPPRRARHE